MDKIESKGFVLVAPEKDDLTSLKGEFVSRDCEVYVLSTPKTHQVCKVVVFTNSYSNWNDIKSDYLEYKELYTKKYGEPFDSFAFFSKPYYEGDGYEMQAISKKKCEYSSYWKTEEGVIALQISSSRQITFGYEDAINMNTYTKEQESNNIDDI